MIWYNEVIIGNKIHNSQLYRNENWTYGMIKSWLRWTGLALKREYLIHVINNRMWWVTYSTRYSSHCSSNCNTYWLLVRVGTQSSGVLLIKGFQKLKYDLDDFMNSTNICRIWFRLLENVNLAAYFSKCRF